MERNPLCLPQRSKLLDQNCLESRRPTTNFCSDLLIEVLPRLPVKTLLKFRCVSKEWRFLIDSPKFASLHLTLCSSNSQNARLFVMEDKRVPRNYMSTQCLIRHCDTYSKTCEFALPKDCARLCPMCYLNGLVLFSRVSNYDDKIVGFIMWNPSIRKSIEIPLPPSSSLLYIGDMRVVFIDADGAGNDYKMVVIPFHHLTLQNILSTVAIEVYSFNTGSWRSSSIDTKSVVNLVLRHTTVVSLNGAVHWIGYVDGFRIVAFDVRSDVFHYFSLPGGRDFSYCGTLFVLGESLALLDIESKCHYIWVMKQYGMAESWVHQFKIDVGLFGRFLYLMRNGKLFFTMQNGMVKEVDTYSGEIKDLAESYDDSIVFMDTFVETLALLP